MELTSRHSDSISQESRILYLCFDIVQAICASLKLAHTYAVCCLTSRHRHGGNREQLFALPFFNHIQAAGSPCYRALAVIEDVSSLDEVELARSAKGSSPD